MLHQRVVKAIPNRPLERLVQNAAPAESVEHLELDLELTYVARRPLTDNRRVQAAELRHVEERPCALRVGRDRSSRRRRLKEGPKLRQTSFERQASRGPIHGRSFKQQPDRKELRQVR